MEVATLFSLPVPTTILYSPRPCLFHPSLLSSLRLPCTHLFSSLCISLPPKFLFLTHLKFFVRSSLAQPFLFSFLSSFLFQFLLPSNFHISPYFTILSLSSPVLLLLLLFSFFRVPSSVTLLRSFFPHTSYFSYFPLTFFCACE